MINKLFVYAFEQFEKDAYSKVDRMFPKKINKKVELTKNEFEYLSDKVDVITEGKGYYLKIKNSKRTKYWKKLFDILIECDKSLGRTMTIHPNFDKDSIYYKVRFIYNELNRQRMRNELKRRKRLGEA